MVRIVYIPPSQGVIRELLKSGPLIRGGAKEDISVFIANPPHLKGSGWFGRVAIPLLKKFVLPNLFDFGSKVLSDVSKGEKWKTSLKRQGVKSLCNTAKSFLSGRGSRSHHKKRKKVNRAHPKQKCKNQKLCYRKTGGGGRITKRKQYGNLMSNQSNIKKGLREY